VDGERKKKVSYLTGVATALHQLGQGEKKGPASLVLLRLTLLRVPAGRGEGEERREGEKGGKSSEAHGCSFERNVDEVNVTQTSR